MLKYLADEFGDRATVGDKSQLEFLRSESKRLEALVVSYCNYLNNSDYRKKDKSLRKMKCHRMKKKLVVNMKQTRMYAYISYLTTYLG
jgi:hypothetical protein